MVPAAVGVRKRQRAPSGWVTSTRRWRSANLRLLPGISMADGRFSHACSRQCIDFPILLALVASSGDRCGVSSSHALRTLILECARRQLRLERALTSCPGWKREDRFRSVWGLQANTASAVYGQQLRGQTLEVKHADADAGAHGQVWLPPPFVMCRRGCSGRQVK